MQEVKPSDGSTHLNTGLKDGHRKLLLWFAAQEEPKLRIYVRLGFTKVRYDGL